MRIIALDMSTHTGWAVLERDSDGKIEPVTYGRLDLVRAKGLKYPWSYMSDVTTNGEILSLLVAEQRAVAELDAVVIEESNGGGRAGRYTQKLIEWLHLVLLKRLQYDHPGLRVAYVSTGDWRKTIKVRLSPDDKKANAALSRARQKGGDAEKIAKKLIGRRGRTKIKHVAVRWANETYALSLKAGDHDKAEALCLGTAFLLGVPEADPDVKSRKTKSTEGTT